VTSLASREELADQHSFHGVKLIFEEGKQLLLGEAPASTSKKRTRATAHRTNAQMQGAPNILKWAVISQVCQGCLELK
jgi:hypothetical protein